MNDPYLNDHVDNVLTPWGMTLESLRNYMWRKGFIVSIKRRTDPEYRDMMRSRCCEWCGRKYKARRPNQVTRFCTHACYIRHKVDHRA